MQQVLSEFGHRDRTIPIALQPRLEKRLPLTGAIIGIGIHRLQIAQKPGDTRIRQNPTDSPGPGFKTTEYGCIRLQLPCGVPGTCQEQEGCHIVTTMPGYPTQEIRYPKVGPLPGP